MRSPLLFLAVACSALPSEAAPATYYASAAGNDANPGTAPAAPWRNLERVNAETFRPGDRILFNCGDEWNGSLQRLQNLTTRCPAARAEFMISVGEVQCGRGAAMPV